MNERDTGEQAKKQKKTVYHGSPDKILYPSPIPKGILIKTTNSQGNSYKKQPIPRGILIKIKIFSKM